MPAVPVAGGSGAPLGGPSLSAYRASTYTPWPVTASSRASASSSSAGRRLSSSSSSRITVRSDDNNDADIERDSRSPYLHSRYTGFLSDSLLPGTDGMTHRDRLLHGDNNGDDEDFFGFDIRRSRRSHTVTTTMWVVVILLLVIATSLASLLLNNLSDAAAPIGIPRRGAELRMIMLAMNPDGILSFQRCREKWVGCTVIAASEIPASGTTIGNGVQKANDKNSSHSNSSTSNVTVTNTTNTSNLSTSGAGHIDNNNSVIIMRHAQSHATIAASLIHTTCIIVIFMLILLILFVCFFSMRWNHTRGLCPSVAKSLAAYVVFPVGIAVAVLAIKAMLEVSSVLDFVDQLGFDSAPRFTSLYVHALFLCVFSLIVAVSPVWLMVCSVGDPDPCFEPCSHRGVCYAYYERAGTANHCACLPCSSASDISPDDYPFNVATIITTVSTMTTTTTTTTAIPEISVDDALAIAARPAHNSTVVNNRLAAYTTTVATPFPIMRPVPPLSAAPAVVVRVPAGTRQQMQAQLDRLGVHGYDLVSQTESIVSAVETGSALSTTEMGTIVGVAVNI